MSDSDAPECISIPESKSIELLRQKHERAARKLTSVKPKRRSKAKVKVTDVLRTRDEVVRDLKGNAEGLRVVYRNTDQYVTRSYVSSRSISSTEVKSFLHRFSNSHHKRMAVRPVL